MSVTSRGVRSRLRSENGSIEGGTTYIGIPSRPSNPGSAKTAASYWSANRRKKAHGPACADEQSKWQRQTHRPPFRALTRLAGWVSCTRVTSASRSSFFALSPFMSTQRASPSSLSTRSAPSSAAWSERAVV
jgi:hypothetical protein